jgi:hypothetical protein
MKYSCYSPCQERIRKSGGEAPQFLDSAPGPLCLYTKRQQYRLNRRVGGHQEPFWWFGIKDPPPPPPPAQECSIVLTSISIITITLFCFFHFIFKFNAKTVSVHKFDFQKTVTNLHIVASHIRVSCFAFCTVQVKHTPPHPSPPPKKSKGSELCLETY